MQEFSLLCSRLRTFWKKWEEFAPQVLLAFIALIIIAIVLPALTPKATNACAPLGWAVPPVSPGNGASNVSAPVGFSWNIESGATGGNATSAQIFKGYDGCSPSGVDFPASCQYGWFHRDSAVTSASSTDFFAYDDPANNHVDYGKRVDLRCGKTYFWKVWFSDSCIGPMVPNQVWSFTMAPCQPQTHMACQNMACVSVSGAGNNTCNSDNDCFHKICSNNACTKVDGAGQSNCTSDSDCVPRTHLTCQDNACVRVSGAGQDICTNRNDCAHFTCQNGNTCALVTGAGQDNCQTNADCVPQTHKECRNQACVPVSGAGNDSCSTDNNCQTHRECRNQACTTVSGSGNNQCNVDGDCVAAQHRTCQNNACVTVSGAGATTCNTDSDCVAPTQSVFCDSIVVNPGTGNIPTTVTATLYGHTQNGGSVASFGFNFGDGSGTVTQAGQTMSHTYNAAGSFPISGFVVDNRGVQDGGVNCQRVVTIYQPQVLGIATPPIIPKSGPEMLVLAGLFGSGAAGYWLRRVKIW